jgi:MFS-type transporter involved in bile tolerance (Atg22 family)
LAASLIFLAVLALLTSMVGGARRLAPPLAVTLTVVYGSVLVIAAALLAMPWERLRRPEPSPAGLGSSWSAPHTANR